MGKKAGYITIADSSNSAQLKEVALLASSIKLVDDTREVCLVTDDYENLPSYVERQFDYVVELPFGLQPGDIIDVNLWQIYYCTPFDENMYLDRQTILLNNIDGVWKTLEPYEMCLPHKTCNFKNETSDFLYYFKCHTKNDIPKYHSDVIYFKKSETAAEFFKMLDAVLQNWRSVYLNFVKQNTPTDFNFNVLVNVVVQMLGYQQKDNDFFTYTFLSLENVDLDDHDLPDDWTRYLSCWVRDRKVKINNFGLVDIVYYNSPTFIDEDVLDDFRTIV